MAASVAAARPIASKAGLTPVTSRAAPALRPARNSRRPRRAHRSAGRRAAASAPSPSTLAATSCGITMKKLKMPMYTPILRDGTLPASSAYGNDTIDAHAKPDADHRRQQPVRIADHAANEASPTPPSSRLTQMAHADAEPAHHDRESRSPRAPRNRCTRRTARPPSWRRRCTPRPRCRWRRNARASRPASCRSTSRTAPARRRTARARAGACARGMLSMSRISVANMPLAAAAAVDQQRQRPRPPNTPHEHVELLVEREVPHEERAQRRPRANHASPRVRARARAARARRPRQSASHRRTRAARRADIRAS